MSNVTGVPKKFPRATAEFTFSMNSSRSGGQKHGIKTLFAPEQLPIPLESRPADKPKSGIRLGSMDTVGMRFNVVFGDHELYCSHG
jgi:hypothetical protein